MPVGFDSFAENISGVRDLVTSTENKSSGLAGVPDEGIASDLIDYLELPMPDDELISLKRQWEVKNSVYIPSIKPRQENNKAYYLGRTNDTNQQSAATSSNLLFQAEETFIPQALASNPEPVVWSDNTDDGKTASDEIKTMLQFHADILCLRKKLGVMVRHWSIYFVSVVKHGWNKEENDIMTEIRDPRNFVLDPDGYIDEFGNYKGSFLGERIECSAEELIELFPKHKDFITIKVDAKMGTRLVRTEWWTDKYSFVTYEDEVLEKRKNEFFNYNKDGTSIDENGIEHDEVLKGQNHFATPKMPYTFLSVFSLQEHPYDDTNLIEQNIPIQKRINDRDKQIDKNLRLANNSIIVSGTSFNQEIAGQAAEALENGDIILAPDGNMDSIKRLPGNDIPDSVFTSQENDKQTLLSVFGVQGVSAQAPNDNTTARGMILNQQFDSSRIGGGVGDALEQVADNIFNWWVQLYYVFYDEPHFAAIMGTGQAVSYIQLTMTDQERRFVVSVSPNSMKPKDEITEQNLAIELANSGWLDPINLFKKLNYPDPMATAQMVTLFKIDPMAYYQQFFPQQTAQAQGAPTGQGQIPPQGGQPPTTLSEPPASASLGQVNIDQGVAMPK